MLDHEAAVLLRADHTRNERFVRLDAYECDLGEVITPSAARVLGGGAGCRVAVTCRGAAHDPSPPLAAVSRRR